MFEHIFKEQLFTVTNDRTLIENCWEELQQYYSTPGRHYHTLTHLDNLAAELMSLKQNILDWQTLIFSIAYHDVIYDVLKNDNEEKSAELAFERLSQLNLSNTQKDKCVSQVLATKGHGASSDSDTNFFTDADLSILGANNEKYQEYAAMIRKEYNVYPDNIYNPGRQKVLRHFLEMPAIYKTAYFRDKYEEKAKKNLHSEWKELS